MQQIGIEAILQDKDFQAHLAGMLHSLGKLENVSEQSSTKQSGHWNALSIAAGTAIGTIVGKMLIDLVPALQKAATAGIDSLTHWGEGLDKLSDQFGFTGEEAAKWTVAMKKVGVAPEEGAAQLNYFTRQLDDVKKAQQSMPTEFISKKTPEQIEKLGQRLDDAHEKLFRAEEALSKAKKPTDAMRYAVDDAALAVSRLNDELNDATSTVPKKMKAAKDSATPFQKALDKLGVSAFDAKGKIKSFDVIMPEIMEHFKNLPAGVESSALAMDLFGARGGTKFLDFLRQGKTGLADAMKLAKEFGLDLSTDQVNAIEQYGFAWNEVQIKIQGMLTQFGTALFPAFQTFTNFLNNEIIPAVNAWVKDNLPKLVSFLQEFGSGISELVENFREGNFAEGLSAFVETLLGLVGIPKDNIKAVGQAVYDLTQWVIDNFPKARDAIVDFWENNAKPKLMAFQKWLDTDGRQALQTFYDKFVEMKPFVDDWLRLLGDLQSSLKDVQSALETTNSALDKTGNHFNALNFLVSGAMDNIKEIIDRAFGAIRIAQQTWQAITRGDFDGFLAGIIDIFHLAWEVSLPGIMNRAVAFIGQKMGELAFAILQAIWGIGGDIFNALIQPFRDAIDWIRDNWGWHSPPRLFVNLGRDIGDALQIGMGKMNLAPSIITPAATSAAGINSISNSRSMTNNFNAPIYGSNYIDSRIGQSLSQFNKRF